MALGTPDVREDVAPLSVLKALRRRGEESLETGERRYSRTIVFGIGHVVASGGDGEPLREHFERKTGVRDAHFVDQGEPCKVVQGGELRLPAEAA